MDEMVERSLFDAANEHVLGVGKCNQRLQAVINQLGAEARAAQDLCRIKDAEIKNLNEQVGRLTDALSEQRELIRKVML